MNKIIIFLYIFINSLIFAENIKFELAEYVAKGDFENVKEIIKENPELINEKYDLGINEKSASLLEIAIFAKEYKIIEFLIEEGAELDLENFEKLFSIIENYKKKREK